MLEFVVRDKSHVSGGSNQEAPHITNCKYLSQAQVPTIHFGKPRPL